MDSIVLLLGISASYDDISFIDVQGLLSMANRIHSHLEDLWNEYKNDGVARGQPLFSDDDSDVRTYRDAITAMTVTYFDCASLILSDVLPIEPATTSREILRRIEICESIFSCVVYLESQAIGCAYMRMMLPLVLVALKSPLANQRQCARDRLQKWKLRNMMAGLCTVALSCVETDQMKDTAIRDVNHISP
jgi:hypothetical protein